MTSTPVRRAPSSVGNPVAVDVIVRKLLNSADGATVHHTGQDYTGSGIVVAVTDRPGGIAITPRAVQALHDLGLTTADLVEQWVRTRAHLVAGHHSRPRAFGAWNSDGVLHLDIVELFSDEDEDLAVAAGHARNQIAIWHNGRQEEILTGGTGA